MMRAFRLFGTSQMAAASEQVRALVGRWAADWLPAGTDWKVRLQPIDGHEPPGGPWLTLSTGAAACFVRREAGAIEACLFGSDVLQHPSPLAGEVGDAALAELARRLTGAGAEVGPRAAPLPATLQQRGSGALRLSIGLPSTSLELLLDGDAAARLVASRARPPRSPARPLHSLRSAIGNARVRIGASIGEAEIDVATLQTLTAGDVLPLNLRVDRPLRLAVAGAAARRGAYLGTVDGHRALRLTAVPHSTGTTIPDETP